MTFAFAVPASGLAVVPKAGTLLARDGDAEIVTPYDDCVLIMPTRRPKKRRDRGAAGTFRRLTAAACGAACVPDSVTAWPP